MIASSHWGCLSPLNLRQAINAAGASERLRQRGIAPFGYGLTHEQPEDRPSLVPMIGPGTATMLGQPTPQRTLGANLQPMSPDSNDPSPVPDLDSPPS